MSILAYLSALLLSAFVYTLFGAYMSVSAGLHSILPLVSFYSSLLVFGVFSWFHFYKPKLGAILLTALTIVMFVSWPLLLVVDYFDGDYRPSPIEFGVPLVLTALTIYSVWKSRTQERLNKYLKIALAIPCVVLAIYLGGYFTI